MNYSRLNVHVWASNREVIRAIWKRFSKKGKRSKHRAARKKIYIDILKEHRTHQELVLAFNL